jgi:hypothetical protein
MSWWRRGSGGGTAAGTQPGNAWASGDSGAGDADAAALIIQEPPDASEGALASSIDKLPGAEAFEGAGSPSRPLLDGDDDVSARGRCLRCPLPTRGPWHLHPAPLRQSPLGPTAGSPRGAAPVGAAEPRVALTSRRCRPLFPPAPPRARPGRPAAAGLGALQHCRAQCGDRMRGDVSVARARGRAARGCQRPQAATGAVVPGRRPRRRRQRRRLHSGIHQVREGPRRSCFLALLLLTPPACSLPRPWAPRATAKQLLTPAALFSGAAGQPAPPPGARPGAQAPSPDDLPQWMRQRYGAALRGGGAAGRVRARLGPGGGADAFSAASFWEAAAGAGAHCRVEWGAAPLAGSASGCG